MIKFDTYGTIYKYWYTILAMGNFKTQIYAV